MRKAFHSVILAAVVAMALCGCETYHIAVTIEPRPDGSFTRTIRLWKTQSNKPDQVFAPAAGDVAAAEPHYKQRLPDTGEAVAFRGTFRDLPGDVRKGDDANRGGYTALTSRLGHVGYYRERRPGPINYAERFDQMREVIELVTRIGATMARQQLEGEEGVERLAKFIEGDLRRDLEQLAYLFLRPSLGAGGKEAPEDRFAGPAAFALQYLEERGYVKLNDLTKLLGKDEEAFTEFGLQLIARRMGRPLDDGLRKRLAFLTDEKRLDAAFKQALAAHGVTADEFKKQTEDVLEGIFDIQLFSDRTEFRIVLVLPPHADVPYTSGKHEEGKVTWQDRIDEGVVTDLFYALWAAPDTDWQKKHLGRIAVTGDLLGEYVMWENALGDDARATWQAALDRLDPKGDLEAQLSAIHLTPPEPDAEPSPERGAEIILEALKPPQDD